MRRRCFLRNSFYTAASLAAGRAFGARSPIRRTILDSHIHLFDPTRAGGIPWPEPGDRVLYRPALPGRYERIASPFRVVGAIAIEASPLPRDNDWLLEVAAGHPLVVGIVGDLVPAGPTFRRDVGRLRRDPLFLGFRYGNLWKRNLAVDVNNAGFVEDLKYFARTGLVFESANPDPMLVHALVILTELVPELKIVVDHLPHAPSPTEKAARSAYQADLSRLAQSPHVFIKLSEIPVVRGGALVRAPEFYRGNLDNLWETFGEDRILYGSDWPNSDTTASFGDTLAIVSDYIATKSATAADKFYSQNSILAYRWHSRTSAQSRLSQPVSLSADLHQRNTD